VVSRFVIDLRVGPRTLEVAKQLVASVALCCGDSPPPLLLIDEHLPYPQAILDVFGRICHRRRRRGRGRLKHPHLKAPAHLLAGVVQKIRNSAGKIVKVKHKALFGRLQAIRRRIRRLKIGQDVNTSHVERLNGTMRCQQTRLARRTRNCSRDVCWLERALWLWRDLYNWTRRHRSLLGATPAMIIGLTDHVWTVLDYVRYPVHASDLQQAIWLEERNDALLSDLERYKRRKCLPTS
jgi:hypothetical protein